jgi:hypothetical protein
MIKDKETIAKYGYNPATLSEGSNKKVIVLCDYCNVVFEKIYKSIAKQRKDINKDCCVNCKYTKREEISILKHGVKNSSQRQDVKKRLCNYRIEDYADQINQLLSENYSITAISKKISIPKTSLNRYLKSLGIDTNCKRKEKINKTIKENYGDDYQKNILEKRKQTNMTKYGYEHSSSSPIIKNKIKENNIKKYGYDHHFKNPKKKTELVEKIRSKYGVDNVFQTSETKEKIKQTNIAKYGYEQATKNPAIKKKIISTMVANGNARIFDGLNCKDWAKKTGYCVSRFNQLVNEHGFEIAKTMYKTNNLSSLEQLFMKFLEDENIEYQIHFRVNNYIADFKLPNNILIECDGLYWHSESCRKRKYHLEKQTTYKANGYAGLFFREDELKNKLDIVKSIVLNKLNQSNIIHARKCSIEKLDNSLASEFFNYNHLMGAGRGHCYGLIYKGNIVSAITIKRLKQDHYEISRFCNLNYNSVTGGFSKLIAHFIKNHKPLSICTFIDNRYGIGKYLPKLGFNYIHTYPSFRWTDYCNTFHRLKFEGNSGYEHGLCKIWDCGQSKYLLDLTNN